MAKKKAALKAGQEVEWKTRNGPTEGRVKRTITSDTKVGGQTMQASDDEPKVLVESSKTGKQAAHKPQTLHKKR